MYDQKKALKVYELKSIEEHKKSLLTANHRKQT